MYEKELKNLTMTPEKWIQLDRLLSNEEYRAIVMDYQKREWNNLPRCNSLFGVCRYYCQGRCGNKARCRNKVKFQVVD